MASASLDIEEFEITDKFKHHQSVPPCSGVLPGQGEKITLQSKKAAALLGDGVGGEVGTQSHWGAFRHTWGFSTRLPLVAAVVMSVKSWNTFCRKINKERLEMETMSSWKAKEAGWGWRCGVWCTQRYQTHPAEAAGARRGLAEGRKLGAGAVESDMIIKRMR